MFYFGVALMNHERDDTFITYYVGNENDYFCHLGSFSLGL